MLNMKSPQTIPPKEEREDLVLQAGDVGLSPKNVGEVLKIAQILVRSGAIPRDVRKAETAFAIILKGHELGFGVMQSFDLLHVIDGKPTLRADALVGLVRKSPQCEYFRCIETTEKQATWETKRSDCEQPTKLTYDRTKAEKAELTKKRNWRQYPTQMLRARCAAELARLEYQDVVAGLYTPDELDNHSEEVEDVQLDVKEKADGK